jgi:enamine deaminase RidA (YjgF/YER057c/UK114 family)
MKYFLVLAGLWLASQQVLGQTTSPTPIGFTYKIDSGMPGQQIYGSTQRPFASNGELVGRGDLAAQALQVFKNLETALNSIGMNFSNIKQVTYHLKGEMNQLDGRIVSQVVAIAGKYLPSGSQITDYKQVPKIAQDEVLIEVEVIAIR